MRTAATLLFAVALVLSAMTPSGALLLSAARGDQSPAPSLLAQPAQPSRPAPNALPVDIRVNAGGPNYTDSEGNLWLADKAYAAGSWGYTAGESYITPTMTISGTSDPTLYRSQHSNPNQYKFDIGNGIYEVQLRFAEIYCTQLNCRAFDVKIENVELLTDFRPINLVGFAYALDATFLVKVTDDQLNIQFVTRSGYRIPVVNAIRVSGGPTGPGGSSVRLNAAGFDYLDTQGRVWAADQAYVQGTRGYLGTSSHPYKYAVTISNTNDIPLMQTNRYGMSGYAFDMENGTYRVDMHFAELYTGILHWGDRVFDVWAEGSKVLSDVDVFKLAGGRFRAITQTFSVNVIDQQLTITFTQKTPANAPIVNAIAVGPLDNTPPAGWANFSPSTWQTTTRTPPASIQVQDLLSGLNVSSGRYAYSTNGGATYSAWLPATVSGSNGVTSTQTLSVATVPFNQDSATQNKIKFRISDMAGTVGESPVYTVQIDTTPPTSAVSSPASGSFVAGPTVVINGTASDTASGVASVEVSTDGGASWNTATGTTSWSYTWTFAGDGVFTIRSRARDNVGFVETPGAGVTVTSDSIAPLTFIRTPTSGQIITSTTYVITGTAYDGTSGVRRVELSFNGGDWITTTGTTTWSYNWTPAGQGSYIIRARAVDVAGNVDTPGTSVNVIVDRVAPTSTITAPASGSAIRGPSYTVSGTASDGASGSGLSSVAVSVDGVNWNLATGLETWTYEWVLPADGSYTIRSRATDLAGNVQSPATTVAVIVDTVAPVSTITFPTAGQVVSAAAITLQGTADDGSGSGLQNVEVSINGGTWVPAQGGATWSYAWTPPAPGPHNLRVRATDRAGNVENPGPGIYIMADTTQPSSSILSPYNGEILPGPTALITGTASDTYSSVARVDVSTNGGQSWSQATLGSGGTWSFNWIITNDGIYSLRSRATDQAGNVESPGRAVSVQVDSIAPLSLITSLVTGQYMRAESLPVSGTASDIGSGVKRIEVSLDNGPWQLADGTTSWTCSVTIGSDGQHTIRSRATDNAGNVETPSAGVSIVVDNSKPTSSISMPLHEQVITAATLLIRGGSSDALSGVKRVEISVRRGLDGFYWNGADWTAIETWLATDGIVANWSYSMTDLPTVGMLTITSRATDNVGNVEIPGAGVTVSIQRGYRLVAPIIISGYTP